MGRKAVVIKGEIPTRDQFAARIAGGATWELNLRPSGLAGSKTERLPSSGLERGGSYSARSAFSISVR